MRKLLLGALAVLALALAPRLALAQTSCSVLTQQQLLALFADNVAAGAITPQVMRNLVCSVYSGALGQLTEAGANSNPSPGVLTPGPIGPTQLTVNITNPATGQKHGIGCYAVETSSPSPIDTNCLRVLQYSLPDNGGETSAGYFVQEGGGNALSVFNLCAQTPTGLTSYCNNGIGIELSVDGTKHGMIATNFGTGDAILVNTTANSFGTTYQALTNGAKPQHVVRVLSPNALSEYAYMDGAGNLSVQTLGVIGAAQTAGMSFTGGKPTASGATVATNSTNFSGQMTPNAASATMTFFGGGFSGWEFCTAHPESTLTDFAYSFGATTLSISATSLSGVKVDYVCSGV